MVESAAHGARTLLAVNPTGLVAGAETVLMRLLRAARAHGWSVRVAVPDGPLAVAVEAEGFPRTPIPELQLPAGPRAVAMARGAGRAIRAGRRIRHTARDAEVVVGNGVLVLPALHAARVRVPVVWLVHDVIERRDWRALLRLCARSVTVAVAPSKAAAQPVRAAGVDVRVIRNGTEWPVPKALPDPTAPPVVGEAAILTPFKGQSVLLDAVARLARRDVVVELVGTTFPKDGPYVEQLRARATEPDLAGRVRFVGEVDDAVDRMRGWTVAVLPSVYPESAGLAVLEAMSIGVPVVATEHGGPPEVIGEAGLLVPPSDPEALADALTGLLDDPALRARCSNAGPRLIAAGLTLERQQEELLALLDEVAGPRRHAVTWVVPDFVPGLGGTSRQTATMAGALRRRGHTVTVLARRRDRRLARKETIDGVAVTRVGLPGNSTVAEKLGLLSVSARLLRQRAGVVQVLMYPDFAVSATLSGRGRRTVMGWAGLGDATDTLAPARGPLRSIQHRLRRAVLRRCANTVLTRAMARELEGLGLGAEVVPLPLDRRRYRPPTEDERADGRGALDLAPDELAVIYVGQLRKLKAVDRLVEAFAHYIESGRKGRLLVVGGNSGTSDACEPELRERVTAAGLDDRVVFTGTVSDVRPYLFAADVFVLPSTREGMPNSLVEAMACGLACVAPAEPVGNEILGEAGVVTADNAPESLLRALVVLADDAAERARLGAAAARAASAWDLERVVDRHEQLYAGLVGEGR